MLNAHMLSPWLQIEARIAELLNGGLAAADPGNKRFVEYQAPREALSWLEWEEGMPYRREENAAKLPFKSGRWARKSVDALYA